MKIQRTNFTQEQLKELMHYDPLTGRFTWLYRRRKAQVGDDVGAIGDLGYVETYLGRSKYYLHRLAWLYTYKCFPNEEIDHINGDRTDNRICNLRLVSKAQNCWNSGMRRDSGTGIKGVIKIKGTERWRGQVKKDGVLYYTPRMKSIKQAVKATKKLREKLHGEFTNHG